MIEKELDLITTEILETAKYDPIIVDEDVWLSKFSGSYQEKMRKAKEEYIQEGLLFTKTRYSCFSKMEK